MHEPEFYTVQRSGVRFDSDGISIKNADGSYHVYYGVSYDMLQDAVEQGFVSASAVCPTVHSWEDWGLFWIDAEIAPPEVETLIETVPGRTGVLDYSEVLAGMPVYHNRTVTLTFCKLGAMNQWHEDYSRILSKLHGQRSKWILDTNAGYYFEGRCSVSSVREDGAYSTFTLSMDAAPFQVSVQDTISDWLWDPFDLESGIIREYRGITVTQEEANVTVYGCENTILYPTLLVTAVFAGDLQVTTPQGAILTFQMRQGENTFASAFPLRAGKNTVRFRCKSTNKATVGIQFREVRL